MRSENEKIKIVIAEDQKIILHSLISLIVSFGDVEIAGTASDGVGLLKKLEVIKPDVIIIDVKKPGLTQVEVTKTIYEKMPWIKIISLSRYYHPVYIKEMLKNGAKGFLSKNCSLEELHEGIRSVYNGKTYFCSLCSQVLYTDYASEPAADSIGYRNLTKREIEIILHLSDGATTKEIANTLFISDKTVERHKSNLLRKMRAKNTAQMVKVAIANGVLII